MIQRIQTIYLLLAALSALVCILLNWGLWIPVIILAVSALFGVYTIFTYSNRMLQAKFCVFNILLLIGWYIIYFVLLHLSEEGLKSFDYSAVLPLLSIVCYVLARRGIIADERLVRAADRIR